MPCRTTASWPVRFKVMGHAPPKVLSKKSPVSGLMEAAHARLALGTAESVYGPTAKTMMFSGDSASVPAFK